MARHRYNANKEGKNERNYDIFTTMYKVIKIYYVQQNYFPKNVFNSEKLINNLFSCLKMDCQN